MNCKTLLKSALSLAIGFAVSSATATDTEIKAIDFESPAYTADTAIGTYAADGWTVGENDASKVKAYATPPAAGNAQYLELDTADSIVSNALSNASDLNTAISNSDVAYFDYEVKFTPATSACTDISNGASKLAFYALVANNDTNLVVVTKDGNGDVIHETTSARVDCTQSVAVHVEITTTNNVMAYSVKVGDTQATSLNAVDADGQTPGQWFRTMNTGTIAHCNFSGSGDIDNFAYGTKVAAAPAEPTCILISADGTTTNEYVSLNDALSAAAAGERVELLCDINLANVEWTPVANFVATFDGKGYVISNLTVTSATATQAGLFAQLGNTAVVRNFTIANPSISAPAARAGAVTGSFGNGTVVSNVTVCGTIQIEGFEYVGGIVGHAGYSAVFDCHVDGTSTSASLIKAAAKVGGIWGMSGEDSGFAKDSTVANVTILATDTGDSKAGALFGRFHRGVQMINCSANNVVVKGDQSTVGAIAGRFEVDDGKTSVSYIIDSSATDVSLKNIDGSAKEYKEFGDLTTQNACVGTGVAYTLVGKKATAFTAGTFTVYGNGLTKAENGLNARIAEGYEAVQQGTSNVYIIRQIPAAQPTTIRVAGNKGTVGLDPQNVGDNFTVTPNQGYIAKVFIDGALATPVEGQYTAGGTNVIAYVKDTAWYLDPAIRNSVSTGFANENSQSGAMDLVNDRVFLGTAPGNSTGGYVEFSLAELSSSVNPELQKKGGYVGPYPSTDYFGRSIAAISTYSVILSGNALIDGKLYATPYGATKSPDTEGNISYQVDVEGMGAGYPVAELLPIVVDQDSQYVYGDYWEDDKSIHKFALVANANDSTKLGKLTWVKGWDLPEGATCRSLAIARIGGKDILYVYCSGNGRLYIIDTTSDNVITEAVLSNVNTAWCIAVTGVADGTPHLVTASGPSTCVYALASDGLSLASATPIASFVTQNICGATAAPNRIGMAAPDNEIELFTAFNKGGTTVTVVEQAPAKYIVRATFSDEANAEDDILVPAGAATNVTFSAPAGYNITSVKVNGTAVPAAGFTSAAYTYSSDAVNGHVYIAMTTEKAPTVIRLAGGTQVGAYADLNAAFAAAQAGDTIRLLADQEITSTVANSVNVTLDLNGFSITDGCTSGYMLSNTDGTLTIVNGSISGDNVLLASGGKIDLEDGIEFATSGWEGTKISGATDFVIGTNAIVKCEGIPVTYYGTGVVDVYGSVTNHTGEGVCLYMDSVNGTINIYDGALVANSAGDAIRPDHGTLNVYGGTLIGNGYPTIYAWATSDVHINLYAGDIVSTGSDAAGGPCALGVGSTAGCTLGADCHARFKGLHKQWALLSVPELCAPGYAPILEDGWYVIKQPTVIRLAGGVQVGAYADIDSAFEAAQAGDTIQLLADQEIEWGITVSVPVTLDLAGFDITRNDDDPWDSMFTSSANITFNGNGGTIDGGILRVLKASAGEYLFTNVTVTARTNGHIQMNDSSVVLTVAPDATFTSIKQIFEINEGTLNVYGTLSHTDGTYSLMTFEDATVNVYTGAVISCSSAEVFSTDDGVSTVNIYGGTITGAEGSGVFCCEDDAEATLNLYGGTINGKAFDITVESNPVTPLTDSCKTLFSTTACIGAKTLADYCANGYAPVLEGDYYVIKASAPASSYPTYIDIADDDMKEAYDDWAQAYNVADGADYEDQFLMNVDPETDVDNAIKITGIEVDGTSVTVTVADNLASIDTLANINGEVIIKGAASLAANAAWTQLGEAVKPTGATVVFDDVNIGDYKFIKAFVVNPYVPAAPTAF